MRREKELIFELMRREGVSQYGLSKRLGKSRQTVNMVLRSGGSMLVSDLIEYASALGYELEVTAKRRGAL